jgi:hypothetical protein
MRKQLAWMIVVSTTIGLMAAIASAGGLFDFSTGKLAATQPQPAKVPASAPATATATASAKPATPTAPPIAEHRTPPATPAPQGGAAHDAPAPTIVVAYARYGKGDRWADVTEPCRRMVHEHGLKFPRDMHRVLGTDPVPGYMKFLELSLIVNGTEMWLTIADNLQLDPMSLSTDPPPEPK